MKLVATSAAWLMAGLLIASLASAVFVIGVVGTPFILACRAMHRRKRLG